MKWQPPAEPVRADNTPKVMLIPILSRTAIHSGQLKHQVNDAMKVPLLDLNAQHAPIRADLLDAIGSVIDAAAFSGGPFVSEFEDAFARYCHTEDAVGVGSGTDALWLALLALGIGPGDEVVTVPMTFIATVEAISRTGARPVFVDIDELTYTMNPAALAKALSRRTKAIVPVHLFGQMADMDPIMEMARARGIAVVEDAAQAHGAWYGGHRAGSMGDAGCFSFYPGKNLGAFGEAGAVVTSNTSLAARIRELRDHGQVTKNSHGVIGWNCRMDGIQAAVLRVKLNELERNNKRRRENAVRYSKALETCDHLTTPATGSRRIHVHHIYAVRVCNRNAFMCHLESQGIGCGIHYPKPVHLQAAYADLGLDRGSFPVAEQYAGEFVSLPMFPELTNAQIDRVVRVIAEFPAAEAAA